jgi:2-polyprenyl-3-methyl-5-hydroxy-6-metoxy-1,4-benzoquinol methylase
MKCPLCETNKFVKIREFSTKALKDKWIQSLGFDPLSDAETPDYIRKIQCSKCKLIYFSPPVFGDQPFYERLSQNAWYYERNKWEFDVAVDYILKRNPSSLLEIGCGEGFFLEKINSVVDYAEGIDINDHAIEVCHSKLLNASNNNIDQLLKKYEMIVLFEVLEHLDNLAEVLQSTIELLEERGVLLIAVPNPDSYLKDFDVCLLDMPPHHNSCWKKETFDFVAKKYKLEILDYKTEPLRYVHYLGYLSNLVATEKTLGGTSLKQKILSKLRLLIIHLLSPLFFTSDKENIVGQTHLVIFRKLSDYAS